MKYRIEHDTMGEIKVPEDKYWGAQTQRSLDNFKIGREKMPVEIIRAFGILKKAAALANAKLKMIDERRALIISRVCDEIIEGKLDEHFPLVVYQTGSGTQTNMNANEVIANRGNEISKHIHFHKNEYADGDDTQSKETSEINNYKVYGIIGENPFPKNEIIEENPLHPNDHVNKSQSSNDTFPTAMHIAALITVEEQLLPAIAVLKNTFRKLEKENKNIIKVGRTHLQDATPLTLGQEISGWTEMLIECEKMIKSSLEGVRKLAIGGTAVGTGLNAHRDFGKTVAEEISIITGKKFESQKNKFHSLTSKDSLVFCHGGIKALSCNLMKIANDIRLLASGPRCGIGELIIPENEPGSSIMPGKVNPTQCEALTMACVQVMGNDTAIGIAASQGNFELNVYMPVLISNFLESVNLMSTAIISFNDKCAVGIKPNKKKIKENLKQSLMLVTALNPHIGYEKAAKVAKLAFKENITLKEAALKLKLMTEEEFDNAIVLENMIKPL